MKKLLTLISAVGMGATGLTGALNVASCSKKDDKAGTFDPILFSVDDRNLSGNGNSKLTVTVSGETYKKIGDYDKTKKSVSSDIIVASPKPAKLNAGAKKLDEILKTVELTSGMKLSEAKNAILKAVKKEVKEAADTDINVVIKNFNIKAIDVPLGEYELETAQPWKNDKDGSVNRYKGYIVNNLNTALGIANSGKALKIENVDVKYGTDNPKTHAPQSATITLKNANSDLEKVFADNKKFDVAFIFNQNIQASKFYISPDKTTSNATANLIADEKANTLKMQVVTGASVSINTSNLSPEELETWAQGTDWQDDYTGKSKDDNKSKIFIETSKAGIKIDASNASPYETGELEGINHLKFTLEGFKEFSIEITVVKEKTWK